MSQNLPASKFFEVQIEHVQLEQVVQSQVHSSKKGSICGDNVAECEVQVEFEYEIESESETNLSKLCDEDFVENDYRLLADDELFEANVDKGVEWGGFSIRKGKRADATTSTYSLEVVGEENKVMSIDGSSDEENMRVRYSKFKKRLICIMYNSKWECCLVLQHNLARQ